MKRNLIAHYEGGGSDKVYMACVRDNNDGTFSVIGKWGRRGSLNQQTVKATVSSIVAAEVEQRKLFQEKLAKGYQDVESQNYAGSVNRSQPYIVPHLEPETGSVGPVKARTPRQKHVKETVEQANVPEMQPDVQPETQPDQLEDDGVVVCINNSGMEDKFAVGVEYIAEPHKDATMLWVYDKFGKKAECFKERFVSPTQYKNGKSK